MESTRNRCVRPTEVLAKELARRGRKWGALNDQWLETPRDYSHGSPFWKWRGANPAGANSAIIRVMQFGSNTAIGSPSRDRTKEPRRRA